ncbi:MAG: DNA gyrase subunit A [Clostridiales bacterium]|nr:DNA gyrase subunit A [Clostridiales bacterium]
MSDSTNEPLSGKDLRKAQEAEVDAIFCSEQTTIIPVDLEKEMKKSFIDYAMSVISDRALPDIRDGLKPVHRRILYSMYTQGFTPDKPYRKCATTVGDVLGRFHPHGDVAVYDALVRLAQDFSMRYMLVEGHGNFGSMDGDPPAAHRYTEARLQKVAMEMMSDINKGTVDFRPNYDEHEIEPVALPSRFPNLLVNGSVGIAVGMATNIPPHNMGEVIDGVVMLLDNPETTVDELMTVIKGPDFPTGGMILGRRGISDTYRTGKGRIVVRAHTDIEVMSNGRARIIVHDLPYMVNKARLIERIAELVKEKKIEGISDIRDESDRNEQVRIVIELRRDANPNVVLNQLYKNSQIQDAFCANMLALVPDKDGHLEPKAINLLDALTYYVAHQEDVVLRRTKYDLEKALARKHIVEGLLIAIDNIDEVIQIIRSSRTEDQAKQRLCERFGFSDKQAQHIVDMRLGRLTGLEREKLEAEARELDERIAYFRNVIEDETLLRKVIKDEILEIKKKYYEDRRTEIGPPDEDEIDDESLIQEEQIVITLTHLGYVKRVPIDTYRSQHRGGRGISGLATHEEDYVTKIITSSTHDFLLCFTNRGRVFRMKGYQVPEAGRSAKGTAVVNLLQLEAEEKIRTIIPIRDFESGAYLTMATREGIVKKTPLADYSRINRSGLIAINIREDDELVGVHMTDGEQEIVLVTKTGMSIRFDENGVRSTGRNTMGVKGITLKDGDEVIGMAPVVENRNLLVIAEKGFGKRTEMEEYRVQSRGGKGLMTYRISDKTGPLVRALLVDDDKDILIINNDGIVIRLWAKEIPVLSRVTQGVTLMRSKNSTIVDVAIVDHEEDEPTEEIVDDSAENTAPVDPTDGAEGENAGEVNEDESANEALEAVSDETSEDTAEENSEEENPEA